jgi:hypothetical protein
MTAVAPPEVRDLGSLRASDLGSVGGNAANLGELIAAGFAVPGGFALPAAEHLGALAVAGIRAGICTDRAGVLGQRPTSGCILIHVADRGGRSARRRGAGGRLVGRAGSVWQAGDVRVGFRL